MDEKTTLMAKLGRKFTEACVAISALYVLAAVSLPVLCVLAVFLPMSNRARENSKRVSCQSNLKEITMSVFQYVQDSDGKYPLVSNSAPGWSYALGPYSVGNYYNLDGIHCPSERNTPVPNPNHLEKLQRTDYWLNARMAGKRVSEFEDLQRTIAFGEGNDGTDSTNAGYHLLEIPQRWRKDEESPLYRHLTGANFAFADGHVKFIGAKYWKSGLDSSDSNQATLTPQPIPTAINKKAKIHKK